MSLIIVGFRASTQPTRSAIALYLPNTPNYTENGDRDRIRNSIYPWRDKFNFNDKEVGLFNINDLEAKIGYDLFSNIPNNIQNALKIRVLPILRQNSTLYQVLC
ncbi:MAG: hypothetical protein HC930_06660 [Hydrococcus sp. SU_1_0]|nr:hypothetical protein [Hydrococcus sp. SU_1_0]